MDKELDILIVEDVPADADAIEEELRREGVRFRARRLETRDQFLTALHHAPPAVVISDFNLPTFDGLDALRLVQQLKPEIPFILVTGPRSEEVAVECMREGADDYILKDSLKRLPSAIHNALRKKAAEQQLRHLPRLIVEAQETERRRVARELHDSVNQVLSSVKFRLESMDERLQQQDERLWREALKAKFLLDKAMAEVIRISRNLRPSELDDFGLAAALRSLCAEFADRTGLHVSPRVGDLPEPCGKEVELALYRIVQEALTNIEKHARATAVEVGLTLEGTTLVASICDNGVGFNRQALATRAPGRGGMGLIDMQERAAHVRGACAINSTPKNGTCIHVTVPLETKPRRSQTSREKRPTLKNPSSAGR